MTAYVEQLRRREKRVNLIEGSLQVFRLFLSNDQARRRLTRFVDLVFDVGSRHQCLLYSLRESNPIAKGCAPSAVRRKATEPPKCQPGDRCVTRGVEGVTPRRHLSLVRSPCKSITSH